MSHSTVLIVGKDPEKQLEPYWELDLSYEEIKEDPRAVFEDETETVKKEFEKYKEIYSTLEKHNEYFANYLKDKTEDEKVKEWEDGKKTTESIEAHCEGDGYTILEDGRIGSYSNPNAKWDWYQLGGRWSGYLMLKDGTRADQAYKKDIDVDAMIKRGQDEASNRYDKMVEVCGIIPIISKWKTYYKKISETYTRDQAIDDYHNQAGSKHFHNSLKKLRDTDKEGLRKEVTWYELDDYQCSKDEYIKRHKYQCFSTFAVLKDNKWYEKGEMGWFGIVSDEKDDWNKSFVKIFDSIDDDQLLSVYDLHI